MALKVVSMAEMRLEVLLEEERSGEPVAELCRRRGITRSSFYEWRERYLAEGLVGLEPHSRRPGRSPGQIEPALEEAICGLAQTAPALGVRAGSGWQIDGTQVKLASGEAGLGGRPPG